MEPARYHCKGNGLTGNNGTKANQWCLWKVVQHRQMPQRASLPTAAQNHDVTKHPGGKGRAKGRAESASGRDKCSNCGKPGPAAATYYSPKADTKGEGDSKSKRKAKGKGKGKGKEKGKWKEGAVFSFHLKSGCTKGDQCTF